MKEKMQMMKNKNLKFGKMSHQKISSVMLKIVNLAQNLLLSRPERRRLLHQHSGLSISFLSGSLYASSMIMVWNTFCSFFSSSLRYFLIYVILNILKR